MDAVLVAARVGALAPPPRPPKSEARLRGGLHTKARDRAVIAHHYDLSNDFYQLILDENMAYSSGYWATGAETLEESQDAKLELICQKLQLQPGMRLLDVGCGWGSLSIHAARHHGVRVTGITLSREQLEFASKRAAELGLTDLIDFRLCDYRDMHDGPFDAATSIEMGEHVGADNYPTFIDTLHRCVGPGGRVLIQQMSRGSEAPGGGPFIESYIAPDMHMRPLGETIGLIEAGGLEAIHVESLRVDYVRTVDEWSATFERNWDTAVRLVGEEVARVWRLYLVGGALAFEEGRMGVDQILATKPAP
jgi:cyclopropane-fatty-acyl-phospholipid synthase